MKVVLEPEFVEFIPEKLEQGKIYISETYATAVHKCACGCGQKVVTPLSPTGWKLTVQGGCVSLYPSIGNWGFPCKSHYFITRNEVRWSYQMTQREIDSGRRYDARLKQRYFSTVENPSEPDTVAGAGGSGGRDQEEGFWQKLKRWLFG